MHYRSEKLPSQSSVWINETIYTKISSSTLIEHTHICWQKKSLLVFEFASIRITGAYDQLYEEVVLIKTNNICDRIWQNQASTHIQLYKFEDL